VEGLLTESFKDAWETFKKDAVLYILASLLMTIVSLVSLTVLLGPANVGFIDIVRRRRRGEAASVGDVMGAMSSFGSSFGAWVLLAVGTAITLLCLVVPGLIFMLLCSFAFHGIAYRDLGAVETLKSSFSLVTANAVPLLVVFVALAVINMIAGSVLLGTLLTTPFSMVVLTVCYERLEGIGTSNQELIDSAA